MLAAENRSFYSDPGISPTGITRAALNNVKGGDLQGGSTITQQYVKNAFTNGDRTFSRKFKELFVTVKLDKQYSKDQILEWYLNTIYFGRGAYGIQAASQAYFGRSVSKLRCPGRRARLEHPLARATTRSRTRRPRRRAGSSSSTAWCRWAS